MRTQKFYDPRGRHYTTDAVQPTTFDGSRPGPVVVLDNNKPNAQAVMLHLVRHLGVARTIGPVEVVTKRSPSEPALETQLAEVARRASLVLTGTAD